VSRILIVWVRTECLVANWRSRAISLDEKTILVLGGLPQITMLLEHLRQ
jgi:hypothetical protein